MCIKKHHLILLAALTLLLVLIPACGGDDDHNEVTSATSQAATTTSAQSTTATSSGEPVKIGVLSAWSGGGGMAGLYYADSTIKTVEEQLEEMGGILGGRSVEFVKFDTGGQVAEAVSGVKKLVTKDNVSVLAIGGNSPAEVLAVSDAAEEERVLFVTVSPIQDIAEKEFTIEGSISCEGTRQDDQKVIFELLTPRPETFAFMSFDDPQSRYSIEKTTEATENAGIETVYGQYVGANITDLSPYLTKIKYEDPDCLFLNVGSPQFMAIAKQIMDLGGWGDIQVVAVGTASSAKNMPGAEGWILVTAWHPSKDDPESTKLKEDFEAVNGELPTDLHVYFYNTLWTAVHAIEQADTDDPEDIARYARSGNLEFDSPMGRQHIGTDGMSTVHQISVQIQEGGVVVPFP